MKVYILLLTCINPLSPISYSKLLKQSERECSGPTNDPELMRFDAFLGWFILLSTFRTAGTMKVPKNCEEKLQKKKFGERDAFNLAFEFAGFISSRK